MIHNSKHSMAGKTVTLSSGPYKGRKFEIEDYADRVLGDSWKNLRNRPICLNYAMEVLQGKYSADDEVVYGKIGPDFSFSELVHVSWMPKS